MPRSTGDFKRSKGIHDQLARLQGLPAIEIRSMSNTTGNQDNQIWDIQTALDAIGDALQEMISRLVS